MNLPEDTAIPKADLKKKKKTRTRRKNKILKRNCDILVIFRKLKIRTLVRQNKRHQFTIANVKQIIIVY